VKDLLELPEGDGWPSWLATRVDTALAAARDALEAIKDGSARSTADVLALWNESDIALRDAGSVSSLLAEVHPDAAVRAQAEGHQLAVTKASTERGLDRALYDVVAATSADGLDADAARVRSHILRDFRRSGVDQPADVATRLRELSDRMTVLRQEIARHIRDDVRSIKLRPDQLDGLPADYIAAHPVDADGLATITTDYPDYMPFRMFATDAGARRALTVEFLNRAWPANDSVLREMLSLRYEQAQLLGYDSWPDFDSEIKMIKNGDAIAAFVEKITAAAAEPGRRDYDVLLARRRVDDPDATSLDSADASYYGELVRREAFHVDAQNVRRYFDFGKVRRGLLDVTARLFGIEYVELPGTAVWHSEVTAYDVLMDGTRLGRIYLDLHPRDGKFKHAAQFDLVGGVADQQLPEGTLVCNFPRGVMEHTDVVTLFHEFGHLVHHVLGGRQRWAQFSGVATEWDFVEAPSQMLEEWAWNAEVLRTFATDDDGEPIPSDLVERMRAAKDFGSGFYARTQMFYAALAYVLHQDRPADFVATVEAVQRKYDLFDYIEGTHFYASFGHLADYTSAYYTYMWSLVIAKDLFSAFDTDDMFDPGPARRYRDEILAKGGSADAADLVARFLGRPFTFDAFAAWLATTPVPVAEARE